MSFPPQAFIIGAQKSATTSLAFLLDQHPMIVLAEPKEPDFLTVNWDKGLNWYRARFRTTEGILLDASVGYSMAPISAERKGEIVAPVRAHSISPDAKFIYMVRDPAERCYSAYWHDVRAGREKRSLRAAIESGAYYVSASFYFRQLENYLKFYSLDRFLIVRFSDFAHDPQGIANRCLHFLGAQPTPFCFAIGEPKNVSFTYNALGEGLRLLLGEEKLKSLSASVAERAPAFLKPVLRRAVSKDVPDLSAQDRALLRGRFAEDAAAFERLTGVSPLD
jgi:hypothetical protein